MALLKTLTPEQAEGKLKDLYTATEQMFGAVPNNVRMLGVSPKILENQLDMVGYFMEHPALTPSFLAMIRMVVSANCQSPYCENFNTGMLMQGGMSAEQLQACKDNADNAPLDDKEKALLKLVVKATKDPHSVVAADIEQLKALGWSEQDVFDAVAHGARSVATNIIFDTFKIDPD
jgi:uncharacterized peroxidase-related enzyme